MKIVVTGASGFLGSHLVQQLVEAGHAVRAMVRKTSDTRFLRQLPKVELFHGTVEDRDSCFGACKEMDAVIHTAGLVKARTVSEFHLTNVIGTQNMVDAAKAEKANLKRFIMVSSLTARAPSPDGAPLPIDAEPRPLTAYGRSKLESERLVLKHKGDLHVTVVRPTGIYGPRDKEMYQLFQYAAMRVLPYIGDPNGKLTLIHGADCARALVLCLTAEIPSGRAYDLDDGQIYTRAQLAEGLEHAVGRKSWISFPIPKPIAYGVAMASEMYGRVANKAVMVKREKMDELLQQWVGDSRPAHKELGFKANRLWKDGAVETAKWYRENGWL